MAVIERTRPIKLFRAVVAFGPYSKGALMQPTGIYRDSLLRKGFIEEVKDDAPVGLDNRELPVNSLARRLVGPARARKE